MADDDESDARAAVTRAKLLARSRKRAQRDRDWAALGSEAVGMLPRHTRVVLAKINSRSFELKAGATVSSHADACTMRVGRGRKR